MRRWLSTCSSLLYVYRNLQKYLFLLPRSFTTIRNYYKFRQRYLHAYSGRLVFLLPSSSIGPAAQTIELFHRHCLILGINSKRDTVVITRSTFVNTHLLTLFQRKVDVIVDDKIVNEIENGGDRFLLRNGKALLLSFRNGDTLQTTWRPSLVFNEEETERGYSLLARLGIHRTDRWVALHNKDDYYWGKLRGEEKPWDSYRSSDFSALLPAIAYLKKLGIHVIRSGHYQDEGSADLPYHSLNTFSPEERMFLELFIQKNSLFSMNGLSGLGNVPFLFDTPCLCHNAIPLGEPSVVERGMIIPKRIKRAGQLLGWNELNQIRTFLGYSEGSRYYVREVSADGFQATYLYEKYGLESIQNTSQELLDGVREMLDYVAGSLHLTTQQQAAQDLFRESFPVGHPMRHFGGIISPSFLETAF